MSLTARIEQLIREAVHAGRQLYQPSAEKNQYYNYYKGVVEREIIRKAKSGTPLADPTPWKQKLWEANLLSPQTPSTPASPTQTKNGTPGVVNGNPATLPTTNNPTWIPGTSPIVTPGTGAGNPVNQMEMNSILTAGVGIVFIVSIFAVFKKVV